MKTLISDRADLGWRQALVKRLGALRLPPHPNAHPRPVTEGIPFLWDTETLKASLSGWINHARHGNTVGLRKAVLRVVPDKETLY